jgi:Rrf2 family protein
MRLATKTRYAVRALFDIAFHGDGKPVQARDVARRQEVPPRYLEQIFQELRRARLIAGKRGPSGGYTLGRGADKITLGDVVRAMQGPIDLLFEDAPAAGRASGSPGREVAASVWRELAERVSACFEEVTLAHLCRRAEQLGISRGEPQGHMYFI